MQASRRAIDTFRGDYAALESVIERSWVGNSQQALSYSAEFLKSLLTAPGTTPALMPALYENDAMLGFVAGFPRLARYRGTSHRLVTNTLLSVLPEYQKSGFGIVLWTELVKRIRAAGFAGMLNFCVDGEPMNRMVEGCCHRLKFPIQRVMSIRYMSAMLKPEGLDVPAAVPTASSVEDFMALVAPLADSEPLARQVSEEEARWQCFHRTGAVFVQATHGSRRGILTGYIMPVLDAQRTKCLLVEDVLWHELETDERVTLLRQFLSLAAAQGARIATVPMLGYADLTAFKKLRFLPTRRLLHCYLTMFDGSIPAETLSSMYLDVF